MTHTIAVRSGEMWILAAVVVSGLSLHSPTPTSKMALNESHVLVVVPLSHPFHIVPCWSV